MTLTDGAWLLLADVTALPGVDPSDTAAVDLARLAAAAWVEQARSDLLGVVGLDDLTASYFPTPDVYQAAVLLTGRIYARRTSPTGLASYGEFGPAAVLRFDPDIERLLGLGRYARPRIG